MQVLSSSAVSLAEDRSPATPPARVSPSAPNPISTSTPAIQAASFEKASENPALKPEPLLTFRRDPSGRAYYLITDAQTGQEIAQLPPEQIRNVGEGIAEYLKQQEAKNAANSHIEANA